jgi:hypothetical protein
MSVDVVVFEPDDLAPVLAKLAQNGWVNLQPEVDVDAEPESRPSVLFGLFGSRGPAVPFCTWHPGERSVGIQHATGTKLKERVEVPPGWRVVQDHPRRGFVAQVTADVTDADALTWLVRSASPLAGLPLLGRWVAEVHS